MNLLCPNCQKMLNVSDQYAGQLMKCPLCSGTFTVPTLPEGGGDDAAPAPDPSAPPADTPATDAPPPPPETFGVQDDPAAPPPVETPETLDPVDTVEPPAGSTPAPPPPSTPQPTGDYSSGWEVLFSPKVLKWVPAGALLLIFFLQMFPWVGIYPGGFPVLTQSAWGAAFGGYTEDDDIKAKSQVPKFDAEEDLGFGVLAFFYLLMFIPTLIVSIAVIVLEVLNVGLPAAVQPIMRWKWGIVAGLNLIMFLFLALQLLVGFNVESVTHDKLNDIIKDMPKDDTKSKKRVEIMEGSIDDGLYRTFWLRLAVWLHIFAILSAAIMFWISQRDDSKPYPRFVLQW